jgi:hypothetical protein
MLTKHTAIEIPADNPFLNDKLERKQIAENLTRLIESTNQPFVISLQAPWGWGKTTFINMWKAHLESLGHICLYFNAWENDFVEDPLIAFIGEINKTLYEKKGKGKFDKQIKKLQFIGGKIIRRAMPLTIQIATQGLLSQDTVKKTSDLLFSSGDELAGFASEVAEERIKQYENDKTSFHEFKKELDEFAKSLSADGNKKPPVIFFVDELDRCRPDFSISLLERIKHVFSVEGIVFVLGIDRNQIEQSVKTLYGAEMDEDGYLRRFIDININLPEPTIEKYCESLFDKFQLVEVFNKRKNGRDEHQTLLRVLTNLSKDYMFSLRVIEQCLTEVNLALRTTPPNYRLFPHLVALLVTLKTHKPKIYSLLQRSELTYIEIKKILDEIKGELENKDSIYQLMLAQFEVYLLYGYIKYEDGRTEPFAELQRNRESKDSTISSYANSVLRFAERVQFDMYYKAVKDIVDQIGLITEFTKVE